MKCLEWQVSHGYLRFVKIAQLDSVLRAPGNVLQNYLAEPAA